MPDSPSCLSERLRQIPSAPEEKGRLVLSLDKLLPSRVTAAIGSGLEGPWLRVCALVAVSVGSWLGIGGLWASGRYGWRTIA